MKGPATQKRAISAREILRITTNSLPDVESFLEDDRTALIAGICLAEDQRDPRTVCLWISPARQRRPTPDMIFTRLLAIRFLALEYEDWLRQRDKLESEFDSRRPDNHGQCKIFIRESRLLDTSQTRGWLEYGQKLLRLERRTGNVGITLAMMFAFPRFPHFYDGEIEHAIHLLNQVQYQDVMKFARKISEEFVKYTIFYRKRMGLSDQVLLKGPMTDFIQIFCLKA
ncbi:uncharacterized protein LDX57_007864 [Aspergillus melleus]|uniref:uncharacterized protein n=1 Tax=Aspergillus melleus TaxID=138277 RepID=UPI001E8D1784|nr:uncharacterized protein LDX57_007864 [Aspergillus melleus]KAH8430194.1 hypothetical protein LDX57_007864 [Aspergillus melleus]